MNVTVTTPAKHPELTLLSYVKAELGLEGNSTQDGMLTTYIQMASDYIEQQTGRRFAKERVTEKLAADNNIRMMLERYPIVQIHGIKYDGSTIGSTTFVVEDADRGFLLRQTGWTDTTLYYSNIELNPTRHGRLLWEVDYTAGYDMPGSTDALTNLPYDVQRAAIDLTKTYYLQRTEDPGVRSQRTGDASETRYGPAETRFAVPPTVDAVLQRYQRLE